MKRNVDHMLAKSARSSIQYFYQLKIRRASKVIHLVDSLVCEVDIKDSAKNYFMSNSALFKGTIKQRRMSTIC